MPETALPILSARAILPAKGKVMLLARNMLICAAAAAAQLCAAPAYSRIVAEFGDSRVRMADGLLVLETSQLVRSFHWNDGDLSGHSLVHRPTGWRVDLAGTAPDFHWPGLGTRLSNGTLKVEQVPAGPIAPAHLRVVVDAISGGLQVRRVCTVAPESAMIGCGYFLKGEAPTTATMPNAASRAMIETSAAPAPTEQAILDRLELPGRHWRLEAVRLAAATDHNDTLVQHDQAMLFRQDVGLTGTILRLVPHGDAGQILILKEAPAGEDQLHYPGQDFLGRVGDVRVVGPGLDAADIRPDQWTPAYRTAVGLAAPGPRAFAMALRSHQSFLRPFVAGRDRMLMANTWGDRSRDSRMREDFVLRELESVARLGLTHLQLDDGWQAGLSRNSAQKAGSLWEDWSAESWRAHPERFPNGLGPVIRRARALNIEIGLWFNPSSGRDYAQWRRDADILIDLYRRHGVRQFKIDGIEVPTKQAERNLRAFFDRVATESRGAVSFNLDVTAGRRPGYAFMAEYGNIFLENRYTDWGNHYPHRTLRNLWSLAPYVPAQRLQIEFLNPFRNADRYPPDDPLAPARIPFDYAFATTMAAQPLAWMETSALPDKAFEIAPLVQGYRAIQAELQSGTILPIGDEPSGSAWTGFQSILADDRGFLIVYREATPAPLGRIRTHLLPGRPVRLEPVLGQGLPVETVPAADGSIELSLPEPFSFALYRYSQP